MIAQIIHMSLNKMTARKLTFISTLIAAIGVAVSILDFSSSDASGVVRQESSGPSSPNFYNVDGNVEIIN